MRIVILSELRGVHDVVRRRMSCVGEIFKFRPYSPNKNAGGQFFKKEHKVRYTGQHLCQNGVPTCKMGGFRRDLSLFCQQKFPNPQISPRERSDL